MALPAVAALHARFPQSTVYTRGRWGSELYAGIPVFPGDQVPAADVAVLFKPSAGAAWRWRSVPRRIGVGGLPLYTEGLPERVEHRRETYARIVKRLGVESLLMPAFSPRGKNHLGVGRYIALNPWSPTATVRWSGFSELAGLLLARGHRVVFFAGPGEGEAVARVAAAVPGASVSVPVLSALCLNDFAATLTECAVFVSNDSGAAHFAAACGAPVLMLHGSTAAAQTGVGIGIDAGEIWCRPCYRKVCFWGMPCLSRIGVERVLSQIESMVGV